MITAPENRHERALERIDERLHKVEEKTIKLEAGEKTILEHIVAGQDATWMRRIFFAFCLLLALNIGQMLWTAVISRDLALLREEMRVVVSDGFASALRTGERFARIEAENRRLDLLQQKVLSQIGKK